MGHGDNTLCSSLLIHWKVREFHFVCLKWIMSAMARVWLCTPLWFLSRSCRWPFPVSSKAHLRSRSIVPPWSTSSFCLWSRTPFTNFTNWSSTPMHRCPPSIVLPCRSGVNDQRGTCRRQTRWTSIDFTLILILPDAQSYSIEAWINLNVECKKPTRALTTMTIPI